MTFYTFYQALIVTHPHAQLKAGCCCCCYYRDGRFFLCESFHRLGAAALRHIAKPGLEP